MVGGMGWRDTFSSIVTVIDDASDRVAAAFRSKVVPVIAEAAGDLDVIVTNTGRATVGASRDLVGKFDERWQEIMVKRIDPLFGKERTSHLAEMNSLDISPIERMINRDIGRAAVFAVAIIGGGTLVPASLYVTVPLSLVLLKPIYQAAQRSVKQRRRVTFLVVSAINVTLLFAIGYYRTTVVAILLVVLSEKLLLVTQDRSQKGVVAVFEKQPQSVWVLLEDGVEVERPFSTIVPGDIVVFEAGSFVAVDGTVVDGIASIDQHMLTGEAQPAEKVVGDQVYASTLVLAGRIQVRVEVAGSDTVAGKIGDALNSTASYQLDLQSRGSKMSDDWAVPTLALSGLALATVGGHGAMGAMSSCFGATLRVSAPITMLNLLNIAAQNAILLKDGRSLELLDDVDTILFDKTGTLTMSQPHVATIYCVGEFDENALLTYAAAAEHRQTHPIALALLDEAADRGLELPAIENARYDIGYGILVELEARTIEVGSDRFMTRSGIEIPAEIQAYKQASHERGNSLIMVAIDHVLAGAIELQPTIRPEVPSVIAALRERGLRMMVVSGDQEAPTQHLAATLGLDRHFANVLPESKAALVEELQAEGRAVCFVGDGINDSIALKKANVSISLSGATTVATDTAQVVFMQESLQQLPFLFTLSDDMARSLKYGRAVAMVPGTITTVGVFFAGWGYYQALTMYLVSLGMALGIGTLPIYKHRKRREENEQKQLREANEPAAEAASPA